MNENGIIKIFKATMDKYGGFKFLRGIIGEDLFMQGKIERDLLFAVRKNRINFFNIY